jgi:5-hydroxyisourate hydrolase
MGAITTHVLDTAQGRAAAGLGIALERLDADGSTWLPIGQGLTDADGRQRSLMPDAASAPPGLYRLTFSTGPYFAAQGASSFYPYVVVTFEVLHGEAHYHVPLLLSPFGYSTYRGT